MRFKSFRLNIIVRIAVLVASIFLLYYSFSADYFFTPVIVGLLIIAQVALLFRYIDRGNRELTSLLESIRFSEFNRSFQMDELGATYSELNKAFNDVMKDFQRVRLEKEEHFHYLQSILQNIDISVIAYRSDGTIELINKAAKKLFQVSGLRNIKALASFSNQLVEVLFSIKPGKNELVKISDDDDFLQLAIDATSFRIKDNLITLVTIKDIQSVLEEQETEAWQKLIRVLTHEIMNSITPISSLSETLNGMLTSYAQTSDDTITIDKDTLDEIQQALKTISKRSSGLMHFVDTYRNLTRIPNPNFEFCSVRNLFENVTALMQDEINTAGVKLNVLIEPSDISFTADEQLIEQVLINLLKNAVQALKGRVGAELKIQAFYNKRGRVTMQVMDNGPGILPDVLERIFIPFFSTKQEGSGIGLSLSRQILRLHNGSITAQSVPEEKTVFTLTF